MISRAATADPESRLRVGHGFMLEPSTYGQLLTGDCFTTLPPAEFIQAWSAQRAMPVQLFTGHGPAVSPPGARVWRIISSPNVTIPERTRARAS